MERNARPERTRKAPDRYNPYSYENTRSTCERFQQNKESIGRDLPEQSEELLYTVSQKQPEKSLDYLLDAEFSMESVEGATVMSTRTVSIVKLNKWQDYPL